MPKLPQGGTFEGTKIGVFEQMMMESEIVWEVYPLWDDYIRIKATLRGHAEWITQDNFFFTNTKDYGLLNNGRRFFWESCIGLQQKLVTEVKIDYLYKTFRGIK